MNGRRAMRAELEERMRVRTPNPHNTAARAPMPPRRARRERIRELRRQAKKLQPELNRKQIRDQFFFRPVIGYVGPGNGPVEQVWGE